MASFKRLSGLLLASAVGAMLVVGEANAGLLLQPHGLKASSVEPAATQCPAGYRARLVGGCTRVNQPRYTCQPGFHRITAPTASGYRCVQNHS